MILSDSNTIDIKLAVECSNAFSNITGLGCSVLDIKGNILHESGYGCGQCSLCSLVGIDRTKCIESHAYGMREAERFGGKYIYFCMMGLGCMVSPVVGQLSSDATVNVGPFRMIDMDDYIYYDLEICRNLRKESIDLLLPVLEQIPYIPPNKVHSLSTLLFVSVGFISKISASSQMLEAQGTEFMQRQISDHILKLKKIEGQISYPFAVEQALLSSIADSNKAKAQSLLNELLGHIIFCLGYDFPRIKTRIFELFVLLTRTAIDAGALHDYVFDLSNEFFRTTNDVNDIDTLCFYLVKIMNRIIDCIFPFANVKNGDIIRKAIRYMTRNYPLRISLGDVAQEVGLSSSYFSKIFKKEMGCNFNTYMNMLRISKSMKLLLYENMELVNIATTVGFEDQSYFTKVFKAMTGLSPHSFRKKGGKIQMADIDNRLPYNLHKFQKI